MRNGYPYSRTEEEEQENQETWKVVKQYFNALAPIINKFAHHHDLYIEKYCHGADCWDLRFLHPKGGRASVNLSYKVDTKRLVLSGVWGVSVFHEFTSYSKRGDAYDCDNPSEQLEHTMHAVLKDIVSWEKSQLEAHPGYENPWKRFTEEEFKKWLQDPNVKLVKNV
tara:strand:+ start:375 stop:875 length:501 start_codon:yes stop_codon:yes gene_type:complete